MKSGLEKHDWKSVGLTREPEGPRFSWCPTSTRAGQTDQAVEAAKAVVRPRFAVLGCELQLAAAGTKGDKASGDLIRDYPGSNPEVQ